MILFLSNTDYPREKLELIICDDGSPSTIQSEMKKLKFDKYLFANKNEGMGANVNKGILASSGEYIVQLQDDWLCKGPKDYLALGIKALEENPETGLVRYRLGNNYLHLTKSFNNGLNNLNIISPDQKDHGQKVNQRKSTFLYSDTPHLKRRKVHEELGLFKSYKNISKTEIDFCLRFNKNLKYNAAYIQGYEEVFQHIGEKQSFRKPSGLSKIRQKIKSVLNF